jgi:hypothetical protein
MTTAGDKALKLAEPTVFNGETMKYKPWQRSLILWFLG